MGFRKKGTATQVVLGVTDRINDDPNSVGVSSVTDDDPNIVGYL
jgi:hypothetical protein